MVLKSTCMAHVHGKEIMAMHTSLYIQCTWSYACLNACTWPFMVMDLWACITGSSRHRAWEDGHASSQMVLKSTCMAHVHGKEIMAMHTSLYIQCTWSYACLNACTWPFMVMDLWACIAASALRDWLRSPLPPQEAASGPRFLELQMATNLREVRPNCWESQPFVLHTIWLQVPFYSVSFSPGSSLRKNDRHTWFNRLAQLLTSATSGGLCPLHFLWVSLSEGKRIHRLIE